MKELIRNNLDVIKERLMQSGLSDEEIKKLIIPIEDEFDRRVCGLVWDNRTSSIPKLGKTLPYFERQEEKCIKSSDATTNNLLIEGDNLYALLGLQYTHIDNEGNGLINVIYIDPPYNTGSVDFIYNDKFKKSEWLSMMNIRLKLANKLLSNDGIIFISIDDRYQAHLKLLCDDIFGENNFITCGFVLDNLKGKSNDNFITSVGHKILVYVKNKEFLITNGGFKKVENIFGSTSQNKYKHEDEKGEYNEVAFKKSGQDKYREARGTMYFPILYKNNKFEAITDEEYSQIYNKLTKKFNDEYVESLKDKYTKLDYEFILPINELGELVRWTSSFHQGYKRLIQDNDLVYKNGTIYEKKRPDEKELLQKYADGVCKSLFYKKSYANGTDDLESVIGKNNFSFPKPITLIKDLLKLSYNNNAIVLDFFAGSGTTGQAVMELNKEDDGNRQFILCTNNENNICQNITHQRLKTVITGIKKDSSKYSEKINTNLYYYKVNTDIIESTFEDVTKEIVLDKFISYISIKENVFNVAMENEYFYLLNSNNKTVIISREYDLSILKLKTIMKEFLNAPSNFIKENKIIYCLVDDEFEEDGIKYVPYPDEVLDVIKSSKKYIDKEVNK